MPLPTISATLQKGQWDTLNNAVKKVRKADSPLNRFMVKLEPEYKKIDTKKEDGATACCGLLATIVKEGKRLLPDYKGDDVLKKDVGPKLEKMIKEAEHFAAQLKVEHKRMFDEQLQPAAGPKADEQKKVPPKAEKADPKTEKLNALKGMTLERVLTDDRFLAAFVKFCEKEFSSENIMFYLTVKGGAKDKKVYETFIKKGSPQQVNLPSALFAEFDAIATSKTPQWGSAPWDGAAKSIMGLMQSDTFPRFKTQAGDFL